MLGALEGGAGGSSHPSASTIAALRIRACTTAWNGTSLTTRQVGTSRYAALADGADLVACRATRALCAHPAVRTAIGIPRPGPTYGVARGIGTAAAFAVSCSASVGFAAASCGVEGRSAATCVVKALLAALRPA